MCINDQGSIGHLDLEDMLGKRQCYVKVTKERNMTKGCVFIDYYIHAGIAWDLHSTNGLFCAGQRDKCTDLIDIVIIYFLY